MPGTRSNSELSHRGASEPKPPREKDIEQPFVTWSLLFGTTWFACFVLFPSWLLPVSTAIRLAVFLFFIAYFRLNTYLVRRWIDSEPGTGISPPGGLSLSRISKGGAFLPVILTVFVILELYPMTFPLISRADEPGHVQWAMGILRRLNGMTHQYIAVAFSDLVKLVVVVLAAVLLIVRIKGGKISNILKLLVLTGKRRIYILPVGALLLLVYFFAARGLEFDRGIIRVPPIAKMLYIFTGSLFGRHEMSFRIVQLIFCLLACVYLYRLVLLFRDRLTAVLAVSIYVFCPLVFLFANLAELSEGIVFFIVAASFYLMRYLKDGSKSDLVGAAYFLSTGFLYKREILFLLIISGIFLLIERRRWIAQNPGFFVRLAWIALAPIVVWLAVGKAFPIATTYRPDWSHWASAGKALAYFGLMLKQLGYFGFGLFLAGFVYMAAARRDLLTRYAVLYFACWYVYYATVRYGRPVPRFSMVFYPVVALATATLIRDVAGRIKSKYAFPVAATCVIVYLGLSSTVLQPSPMDIRYVAYKDMKSRYLPYDAAVPWIKDNIDEGSRILITMGTNPLAFYRDKYNVKMEWLGDIWVEEQYQTADNLYAHCIDNNIQYVMFPTGRWLKYVVNEQMVDRLASGVDERFEIIKQFEYGRNRIFIWTIRRS